MSEEIATDLGEVPPNPTQPASDSIDPAPEAAPVKAKRTYKPRTATTTKAGYPVKPAPIDPATGEPIKRGRGRPPGARSKSEHELELVAEVEQLKRLLAQAEANQARVDPDELLARQYAAETEFKPVAAAEVLPPVTVPQAAVAAVAPGAITVHFVEDGFTAFGKLWYRGETLTVEPDTENWKMAHDRENNTWLTLDEYQQEAKWGRRYFRPGPWRGAGFDLASEELTEAERATLARVQQSLGADSSVRRALG